MNLPETFKKNIRQAFPGQAEEWLGSLPEKVRQACQRWNLTAGEPMPLSYNYVCAAQDGDGTPLVLKIGVPNEELTSEIAALRLYDGQGACRLVAADAEEGLVLLERLLPGKMLHEQGSDEEQTRLAAGVMKRLWRPAPRLGGLLTLAGWFAALQELRPRFRGGTGPFPPELVAAVESLLPDLFAGGGEAVVLHGDCHHFNILSSQRGWLAIDPKGVVGPRGYEPAPFLLNPWEVLGNARDAGRMSLRRIAIFSEELGLGREILLGWGVCHSLLSAWWDLQADNRGGEYAMGVGQMLLG